MPSTPTDEVRALLVGRAVDAAACTSANVYVNGKKLPVRSLRQYALAFGGELLGADSSVASADDDGKTTVSSEGGGAGKDPSSKQTQNQREETPTDSGDLAAAHVRVVVTTGVSPPCTRVLSTG